MTKVDRRGALVVRCGISGLSPLYRGKPLILALCVERLRQRLELPQSCLAQTTEGAFLELVGDGADQEIAAEPLGWRRAVEPPPLAAEFRRT